MSVFFNRYFARLQRATNYRFRRRERPGGPRLPQRTDLTAPHGGPRRHESPYPPRQFLRVALPPWLVAAAALQSWVTPPATWFLPSIALLLFVRTVTIRAATWARLTAIAGLTACALFLV